MPSLMTTVRYAATGALAGLTTAYAYYPGVKWLPIAIAVVGTLGIHVVPAAVTQTKTQQETPKP